MMNETPSLELVPTLERVEGLKSSEHFLYLLERSKEYAKKGLNPNTRRAHETNWRLFSEWCESLGHSPLPAHVLTLRAYITELADAGRKHSTIESRLATISKAHQLAGLPSPTQEPTFKEHYRRLRNVVGRAKTQKKALLTPDIQMMLAHLPQDKLLGVRDRALILLGFVLFNRRSEIAALNVEDIEFCQEGMLVTIRKSKTDQAGEGKIHGVHFGNHTRTCPVHSMKQWLEESGIVEGAVFRRIDRHGNLGENAITGRSIARIIKRYALKAGLDPTKYSAHSLRRGGITNALMNGVSIETTSKRSNHSDINVFMGYVEEARRFQVNITAMMGL